jgi:hypothetical protein
MTKRPEADEDVRECVRELGRRESAAGPSFDRVWRGRAVAGRADRIDRGRLVVAAAGMAAIALLAWWWPKPAPDGPQVAYRPRPALAAAAVAPEWSVPTDGLLAGVDVSPDGGEAETDEVRRLAQDIERLLKP